MNKLQPDAFRPVAVFALLSLTLGACTTTRMDGVKTSEVGVAEGETVVVMARSYHLGNETEDDFTDCVGKVIAKGRDGLEVIPDEEFVDALFPWFEPRTAPADTKALPKLMKRPGVVEQIERTGVRYLVWLDGNTERTGGGGSLSCAAGPGGGGCFGFAWWETASNYEASVWDLKELESAGTVEAEVEGTSYLPAIVVPVPLIARTQSTACKSLGESLRAFLIGADEEA